MVNIKAKKNYKSNNDKNNQLLIYTIKNQRKLFKLNQF